jgi:hypothetical protein
MNYLAAEVFSLETKYRELIASNEIQIERMDSYCNPEPLYSPKARKELIAMITKCQGFSWSCNMQNSMSAAVSELADYVKDAYEGGCGDEQDMLFGLWRHAKVEFNKTAMEELREIFYKGEIAEMLKTHPTYDKWVSIYHREHGPAEEMDDSAERVSDMRAA